MKTDSIAEIGIDEAGRLYIKPASEALPYIYRAAMGVDWNEKENALCAPVPREFSYFQWYKQMCDAVRDEYRISLRLSQETEWKGIPSALRMEIERHERDA